MRLRMVGYTGARPPVPGTVVVPPIDPPDDIPIDPDAIPEPLVVSFADDDVFHKMDYLALGYNRFEVICVGAAGGGGGGFWWDRGGDGKRVLYGGEGGGGGLHRVRGRLALLPTNCPVVVGQAGVDVPYVIDSSGGEGVAGSFNAEGGSTTTGRQPTEYGAAPAPTDGGYSSFNGVMCRASGGKAGQKTVFHDGGSVAYVPGGSGGLGGSIEAGAAGSSESWNGTIGSGGRGGRGGGRVYYDNPYNPADLWTYQTLGSYIGGAGDGYVNDEVYLNATDGGRGAYSESDSGFSGPGEARKLQGIPWTERIFPPGGTPSYYARYATNPIIPGVAGGVRAFPLNGDTHQYGSKLGTADGAVIIRLTYVTL